MKSSSLRLAALLACAALFLAASVTATDAARPGGAPQKKRAFLPDKRTGQDQIEPIIDGNPAKAVELCLKCLQADPRHLESLYNLTVAYCHLGQNREALATMRRALEAGLPPGRFIAGPRELLAPLAETDEFRRFAAGHSDELLHGPMLGCVTDRSAKLWVRTPGEAPIQAVLSTAKDLAASIKSSAASTRADRDFTAVVEVEGLRPDTQYYYDVLLGGKSTQGPSYPSFRTFPPAGKQARFQVGFGGGAGYTPMHERMWDTITSHHLSAFLLLGDNVYIDNPTRPAMQHYTYYRRQSRPEYRRFVSSTPIFAIWDDHDFGVNDCFYGSEIDMPAWKIPVWKVFVNNWNNPAYGGGPENPGCWFRFSIAEVDFFMLDCRFYRSNPKKENPTMLGPVQMAWLLEELGRSRATFKVLASSVPWTLDAKGNSLDTWRGFQAQREEIFSLLETQKIDGVALISADRHRSDCWRIDRPRGYPLYEFESSRLTNIHTHPVLAKSLFGYNQKCSFGLLGFDTTKPDPELTYQIVNIGDELIHTFVVKKSMISHK